MGKKSSEEMSTLASHVLKSSKYAEDTKKLAGSVLSQADSGKGSSEKLSTLASKKLKDKNSSKTAKKLAGSVLSQAESSDE